MGFSRQSVGFVLVTAGVMAGCSTPQSTHPRTAPPPAAPANAPAGNAGGAPPALSSAPRYNAGRQAYNVVSTGTVGVAGDSGSAPDTVRTDALVRFNADWTGTGLDVTGTVVWRVSASSAALQSLVNAPVDPVPFRATVDTARSTVRFANDSGTATHCPAANAAALAAVRELLADVPRTLAPGSSWVDTVVTTTCRGEIPVTSTAVRRFAVTLERVSTNSEGVDILVSHTSAVELRGQTTRSGSSQPIVVSGTGSGQSSQHYTALTGRLVSSTSASDIDLSVGLPGRAARLHQHAESQVKPATP